MKACAFVAFASCATTENMIVVRHLSITQTLKVPRRSTLDLISSDHSVRKYRHCFAPGDWPFFRCILETMPVCRALRSPCSWASWSSRSHQSTGGDSHGAKPEAPIQSSGDGNGADGGATKERDGKVHE